MLRAFFAKQPSLITIRCSLGLEMALDNPNVTLLCSHESLEGVNYSVDINGIIEQIHHLHPVAICCHDSRHQRAVS